MADWTVGDEERMVNCRKGPSGLNELKIEPRQCDRTSWDLRYWVECSTTKDISKAVLLTQPLDLLERGWLNILEHNITFPSIRPIMVCLSDTMLMGDPSFGLTLAGDTITPTPVTLDIKCIPVQICTDCLLSKMLSARTCGTLMIWPLITRLLEWIIGSAMNRINLLTLTLMAAHRTSLLTNSYINKEVTLKAHTNITRNTRVNIDSRLSSTGQPYLEQLCHRRICCSRMKDKADGKMDPVQLTRLRLVMSFSMNDCLTVPSGALRWPVEGILMKVSVHLMKLLLKPTNLLLGDHTILVQPSFIPCHIPIDTIVELHTLYIDSPNQAMSYCASSHIAFHPPWYRRPKAAKRG